MRVIRDTDTVEFVDESGDKLVLLEAPRQRDVLACEAIEQEDAFAQLENLRRMGFDVDALIKQARESDVKRDERDADVSAKVRAKRLEVLAVALIVGGDRVGGKAIAEAYGSMDASSAAWVDAKVAEVWDAATPSDASARGQDADARVSASVSAAD
jgi:hypothetical protein